MIYRQQKERRKIFGLSFESSHHQQRPRTKIVPAPIFAEHQREFWEYLKRFAQFGQIALVLINSSWINSQLLPSEHMIPVSAWVYHVSQYEMSRLNFEKQNTFFYPYQGFCWFLRLQRQANLMLTCFSGNPLLIAEYVATVQKKCWSGLNLTFWLTFPSEGSFDIGI